MGCRSAGVQILWGWPFKISRPIRTCVIIELLLPITNEELGPCWNVSKGKMAVLRC